MSPLPLALAVCASALALCSATVRAQDALDDERRAFALMQRSQRSFEAGDYEEAERLLEAAYVLHAAPALLFNLGRVRESREDVEGAAEAYRRFLEADPDADVRADVEARIAALESEAARRAEARAAESPPPAPLPAPPPPAPPPREEPTRDIVLGATLLTVGITGALSSVLWGVFAQLASERADDPMATMRGARSSHDEAVGFGAAAIGSLGLGLLNGIIGLVVLLEVEADEAPVALGTAWVRGG